MGTYNLHHLSIYPALFKALKFCFVVSENKMTLADLLSLEETMQNLPCVMNQLEEVQVSEFTIMLHILLCKLHVYSTKPVHFLVFRLCYKQWRPFGSWLKHL